MLDSTTKFKLVKAYCISYYGFEIWNLWSLYIEDMCVALRYGIRRILGLPDDSHIVLLPVICNDVRFWMCFVSDQLDLCRIVPQARLDL